MAKILPTKAEFLGVAQERKEKEFRLVLEDSPGQKPRVTTNDDGSLSLGEILLTTNKDAIDVVTRICVWFGVVKSDLTDLT